jgi:hypothetical protein
MAPTFFRILLAFVAAYAFWFGRRDERVIGVVLVVGVIASHYALSPLHSRFAGLETTVMAVDALVFLGFLWVALVSERFWPLWIAGLQLTAMLGHLLKLADTDMFPKAYGAALFFWAYPIVIILAVGTWRSHRRLRQQEPRFLA